MTRQIDPIEFNAVCRKCIYNKITDEELENCPVCNIDLGIVPLEKMRSVPSDNFVTHLSLVVPFLQKEGGNN